MTGPHTATATQRKLPPIPVIIRVIFGRIKRRLQYAYHRAFFLPGVIKQKRKKDVLKIAFLALTPGMWKYDEIFQLMRKDPRFDPVIIPIDNPDATDEENRARVCELTGFFASNNLGPFVGHEDPRQLYENLQRTRADMVFLCQPYPSTFSLTYRQIRKLGILIGYLPYSFGTTAFKWGYNNPAQNFAWINFYPTQSHRQDARRLTSVGDKNVRVVGYPNPKDSMRKTPDFKQHWKLGDPALKRVIWATHYSVLPQSALLFSTFLELCDTMPALAKKYAGKIQFAFKPHPLLEEKLHKIWGVQRTQAYYRQWEEMPNTCLVTDSYQELFNTSDALVHDCGSFTIEYLYENKPVMYLTRKDRASIETPLGQMAIEAHYPGRSQQDIERFLEMVIAAQDPMRAQRDAFCAQYLNVTRGHSVGENMMRVIEQELGWKA